MSHSKERCTFAIISHPDAGKTTLTEKLLLLGGAIALAGTVKGRKASRYATSDWLELEKKRGISVTTSVMQFPYKDVVINLLDTPGHADFSEDTYRTLTAVDSTIMVLDVAKGVEERTLKLMEVCRLRDTPIMTFINKLDREGMDPLELLDHIEKVLGITCAPVTWPIGSGKSFKGIYHLLEDRLYLYDPACKSDHNVAPTVDGLKSDEAKEALGDDYSDFCESVELVQAACMEFDRPLYLSGDITPVYFGSAMNNMGVRELLDGFTQYAPRPLSRQTLTRKVEPTENTFSGFVFKIQANMDPQHRDRMAFMRIVSGSYRKGMKTYHVREAKQVSFHSVHTFMAAQREHAESAEAGDIVGIHTHGGIKIGDAFTEGESLKYIGIPHFSPELFRVVRLTDPLKQKALVKGLVQLSEEGATQVFRPLFGNDIILGAIGVLQFDVVAHRLESEYRVSCVYEAAQVALALWVEADDDLLLERFKEQEKRHLAIDGSGALTYLAPSRFSLQVTQEYWPDIQFLRQKDV